jgi:uncharacterized membrane protein YfcA
MNYFANLTDFGTTVIKVHAMTCIGGVCTAVVGFATGYIYDDFMVVATMVGVLFGDIITGIYASYIKKVEKEKKDEGLKTLILAIQSRKLLRAFIAITFHLGILSAAWHISKSQAIYSFLPQFLVGAIFCTQFVSIAENLYKAKVIKGKLFDLIVNKMNWTNISEKTTNPTTEESEQP